MKESVPRRAGAYGEIQMTHVTEILGGIKSGRSNVKHCIAQYQICYRTLKFSGCRKVQVCIYKKLSCRREVARLCVVCVVETLQCSLGVTQGH